MANTDVHEVQMGNILTLNSVRYQIFRKKQNLRRVAPAEFVLGEVSLRRVIE